MSVNVIKLRTDKVEPVQKIRLLPNLFSNLLRQYRQKQDRKKSNFYLIKHTNIFMTCWKLPKLQILICRNLSMKNREKELLMKKQAVHYWMFLLMAD